MSCNIIAESNKDTVIAEYTPEPRNSTAFQTEAELEREFIRLLCEQGYNYLQIHSEKDLLINLRAQLEKLNHYKFSDSEWDNFFKSVISSQTDSKTAKTERIQENFIHAIKRDDGTTQNIMLINKENIHENILQVINQYSVSKTEDAKNSNRYDVTILVNGLPLVHIELKRRGVAIREAFNQIDRYKRESFGAGYKLFDYVQIFVISNGTDTKYYANTTRFDKSHSSFDFTSYWADAGNKNIHDLIDFTKTFFARHTILNVLTKYCVFTSEQKLMVMRPYQITATERIINKIKCANNYKRYGTIKAGGYIWHTTGSGKTLTSFKTAIIAANLDFIDKVLFVVDRKDLDTQTMNEYNKYKEGAANSNSSTRILQAQLSDSSAKIIITTIQKLAIFIRKNKSHSVYNKHVVIIFDECHRSQFGDMHRAIIKTFKNYYIFGFTGTPIFAENSGNNNKAAPFFTTDLTFGDKIHAYTILNAIQDKNVLPFRVYYYSTMHKKENIIDELVHDIDREKAYNAPERISQIVKYVIEHFNEQTRHREFNSIFAASSINAAMLYYNEFKKQAGTNLKVAIIYSYSVNNEENSESTAELDNEQRELLETAIKDYNSMFSTNYDTSSEKFQNYYKDVSMRTKNREIDILIVVNMFLTGFDAQKLNTLWVDKNLKMHGLIQAFSRTNRIYNERKHHGNIICFRNLQNQVDEAIKQFGNDDPKNIIIIREFEYYHKQYSNMIQELINKFPLESEIMGESNEKNFIALFGAVLKMQNLLSSFEEFSGQEIISTRDFQDYQSKYLDLRDKYKRIIDNDEADINNDIVFEIELLTQVDINIDYILMLAGKYKNDGDKEILITIQKTAASSPELRSKRELIEIFMSRINDYQDIITEWREFVRRQREKDLIDIIKRENLNPDKVRKFIKESFKAGYIKTTGTYIRDFMPPVNLFDKNRESKKARIIQELRGYLEKYSGI